LAGRQVERAKVESARQLAVERLDCLSREDELSHGVDEVSERLLGAARHLELRPKPREQEEPVQQHRIGRKPDRDVGPRPVRSRPGVAQVTADARPTNEHPRPRVVVEAEHAHARELNLRLELRVEADQDVDAVRERRRIEADPDRIADETETRVRPRVLDLAQLRLPFAGGGHRN
jgi:hypothetical protein